MSIRKKAFAAIVAIMALIAATIGISIPAFAEGNPTDTTTLVQSTDTNVASQPEGDVVGENDSDTENTDTANTPSSSEEAPTKAAEPETVAAPTSIPSPEPTVADTTNSAPAQSEAAQVQAQVVATPSPTPTQGTGLRPGSAHTDIFNGSIDYGVGNVGVKFEYVIKPNVPVPTQIRVIVWKGYYVFKEQAAVDTISVSTSGFYEKKFYLPAGDYTIDIQTAVEGSSELKTYNGNVYEGQITEPENQQPIVMPQPKRDGNSVEIEKVDGGEYYNAATNETIPPGKYSFDSSTTIETRPTGNRPVTGGPWTYVPEVKPTPTPTPTPSVTPTPKPTASPTPTSTPKPTPTSTPKPTASPTPQPSVSPTVTPTPNPEPTASPTTQPDPSSTASPIPAGGQPGSGTSNSDKSGSIKYYPGNSKDDNTKKTLAVTGQEDPTRLVFGASALLALGLMLTVGATFIRRRRNSTS